MSWTAEMKSPSEILDILGDQLESSDKDKVYRRWLVNIFFSWIDPLLRKVYREATVDSFELRFVMASSLSEISALAQDMVELEQKRIGVQMAIASAAALNVALFMFLKAAGVAASQDRNTAQVREILDRIIAAGVGPIRLGGDEAYRNLRPEELAYVKLFEVERAQAEENVIRLQSILDARIAARTLGTHTLDDSTP